MTGPAAALSAFVALDLERWPGLPADARITDFQPLLDLDPGDRRSGDAGTPRRTVSWVPSQSPAFAGGLRLWLDDEERVVLLEGLGPGDATGDPLTAPVIGEPDATYDAVLGPFHVRDAERVHAGRGLALQVAPETGVLVCVLGFTPTDTDDYRARLQPHREPLRPLARPGMR